eukprot:5142948-Lingulodinium_polyedra.AAC.1
MTADGRVSDPGWLSTSTARRAISPACFSSCTIASWIWSVAPISAFSCAARSSLAAPPGLCGSLVSPASAATSWRPMVVPGPPSPLPPCCPPP